MKIPIRFFNDCEVRAVWEDENAKWRFPVQDIVGILNEEDDYSKTRNYRKYLKNKLKTENNELVNATNQLKLPAADGKRRLTDTFDSDGVIELAKHFPNNRAMKFPDWFLYSDASIHGQSIDYPYYYEEN